MTNRSAKMGGIPVEFWLGCALFAVLALAMTCVFDTAGGRLSLRYDPIWERGHATEVVINSDNQPAPANFSRQTWPTEAAARDGCGNADVVRVAGPVDMPRFGCAAP